MCEFDLVEGRKYKVRLKPLEELLEDCHDGGDTLFADDEDCWDVEAEHHTTNSQGEGLCKWFSRYLDGGLGYFTFHGGVGGGGAPSTDAVVVWDVDGDSWYYQWDQLKVLGEV